MLYPNQIAKTNYLYHNHSNLLYSNQTSRLQAVANRSYILSTRPDSNQNARLRFVSLLAKSSSSLESANVSLASRDASFTILAQQLGSASSRLPFYISPNLKIAINMLYSNHSPLISNQTSKVPAVVTHSYILSTRPDSNQTARLRFLSLLAKSPSSLESETVSLASREANFSIWAQHSASASNLRPSNTTQTRAPPGQPITPQTQTRTNVIYTTRLLTPSQPKLNRKNHHNSNSHKRHLHHKAAYTKPAQLKL